MYRRQWAICMAFLICSFAGLAAQTEVDSLLEEVDKTEENAAKLGRLYHELGKAYDAAGDLPSAISATEKALEIRLMRQKQEPDDLLKSAFNLGCYYHDYGDEEKAFTTFQLILDRTPNAKEGVTYFRLGCLYGGRNELVLADRAFNAALEREPFLSNLTYRINLLLDWGAYHQQLETMAGGRRAIEIYLRAQQAMQDKSGDDYTLLLNRMGLAHADVGEYNRSIAYLRSALINNGECCNYDYRKSEIFTNLGLVYRRKGDLEGAEEYHQQALAIDLELAEGRPDQYVAVGYNNLATVAYYHQDYSKSFELANEALRWVLPEFESNGLLPKEANLASYPDLPEILTYLRDAARAAVGQASQAAPEVRNWPLAINYFRLCDVVIDELRRRQIEENSKLLWREQAREVYAEAVAAATQADDPSAAFFFAEKSRAMLFLDDRLQEAGMQRLPSEERLQIMELSTRLRYWRETPGFAEDLIKGRESYRTLQDSLRELFPAAFRFTKDAPQPSLAGVSRRLRRREVLVEYFLHESISVAVKITNRGEQIIHLPALSELLPLMEAYQDQLWDPHSDFATEPAIQLYNAIIAPLELDAQQSLIIVADGLLRTLPFSALLSSAPSSGTPYAEWSWLHKEHPITRAWSAQLYFLNEARSTPRKKRLLYFAPAAAPESPGLPSEDLLLPLSAQPDALLSPKWGADQRIAAEASRIFLQEQADNYAMLHLATHGYLGKTKGAPPYFLVADKNFPFYTAFDLLDHRLTAELVTLSACQTGLGESQYGEGIASLGRAFARRGAESVAISLWPVDEGASVNLLRHFYDNLLRGDRRGDALAWARTRYLEEQTNNQLAHPYRWAGFIYYGPNEPLDMITRRSTQKWWLLGLIGVVLLGLVIWKSVIPKQGASEEEISVEED
ncbi:MAG: CHAT domain-containing tetratricopeptide repeat protein [Bacteroidota bacterium]